MMEDREIVDLYWARQERAIEETDRKYQKMLKGISSALVPTLQDAEECVSDTYLAAWNSMPTNRPVYLGAYLSKIIRRMSTDKFRASHAEKRGGMLSQVEELTECIPSGYDLENQFFARQLAQLLDAFLLSLDAQKRYIFVRRYYYADSLADIANNLGIREGKVKTVLHRTRNALRIYLEKGGFAV